jgi:hypothetical protein
VPVAAFEWTGALLGLLGAFLLATHSRVSRYGWLAYLGANVAMTAFAAAIGAYGLLIQQLGFTITTLLGLYRSGLVALRNDDR